MSERSWSALTIAEVQELLAPIAVPYWIAGGHAIDLFVGRSTRAHEDTDLQILRADEAIIARHLAGWELYTARAGQLDPWSIDHHAHIIWCRPSPAAPWALELLVADVVDGRWIYRRDPRISRPLADLGGRRDGIPFIRAEVQLLYKSKRSRPQDEADFQVARPLLLDDARTWLRNALTIAEPGHPWLREI